MNEDIVTNLSDALLKIASLPPGDNATARKIANHALKDVVLLALKNQPPEPCTRRPFNA